MEELKRICSEIFQNELVIQIILSNIKSNENKKLTKVNIHPFMKKEELFYQFEYFENNKALHKNFETGEAVVEFLRLMESQFKNATLFCNEADYQVLTSKKGKVTVLKYKPTKNCECKVHNKKKEYMLEEGIPVDFLVYLEVMNKDGRVFDKKRDKFKQINKFLEIVEDSLGDKPGSQVIRETEKVFNIIDFGCGKAYLTFALYHYLVKIKGYKVNIIGLDIKQDVIELCNKVANELAYDGLKFELGEIKDFNNVNSVDMVVTLHACDTATDDALIKAIEWGAKIILSVPCCQHELFKQIENELMKPLLKHGLIKERLSALITDSIRVKLLETIGYNVSVIEFIDIEHTPKNLMIKAIKGSDKINKNSLEEYNKFKEFWSIEPHMEKMIRIKC